MPNLPSISPDAALLATPTGISAAFLRTLADAVVRIGGDRVALASALGLSDPTPSATIPTERVARAVGDAERTLGLPSLGVALARSAPVGAFGFVDYAVYASSTLRDAILRLALGYRHLSPRATLVLDVSGTEARVSIRHRSGAPLADAVLADFTFALLVVRARTATGREDLVRAVHLTRSAADPVPFEALFGARVSFDQPLNELVLDAGCLDLRFATADARVAAILDSESSSSEPALLDRARATLVHRLRDGGVSVEDLARALRISPRTLQRQLKALGTSHRQLLEDVRRALAEELLRRDDLSLAAVADELGFATATAFHRAFHRWTGSTPGTYRNTYGRTAPPPPPSSEGGGNPTIAA